MLAEVHQISVTEAIDRLRGYAHRHNQHLTDVARQIVSGSPPAARALSDTIAQSHTDATPQPSEPANNPGQAIGLESGATRRDIGVVS